MKEVVFSSKGIVDEKTMSPFKKYLKRVVGKQSFVTFMLYEICLIFLKNMEGTVGIFLRQKLYRFLLAAMGNGVFISSHVTFRIPSKIRMGSNVFIDEDCSLDVKDAMAKGIDIEDDCVLHKGAILSTGAGGNGFIRLDRHVSIGPYSQILGHGGIEVGANSAIAGGVVIVSTNHGFNESDVPIYLQPSTGKGIKIGENVWIGAGVKILDGVTIGNGVVIGAGSVVTKDIPERCVAVGVPARVVRKID